MPGYRINRITSDIKLCLSEILKDTKDPRVSRLLSIVKVDVSSDLSYATVYVSAIEGFEETVKSVKALKGASGYLRRELGSRMSLRKVPIRSFPLRVSSNGISRTTISTPFSFVSTRHCSKISS